MTTETRKIFFALLRNALSGEKMTEEEKADIKAKISDDVLSEIYDTADRQDLAHLVGYALINSGIAKKGSEMYDRFYAAQFVAMCRYENISNVLKQVSEQLEKAQIDYLPLKGAVMRKYYPQPWMRTSCDIDILVHEADAEMAAAELKNSCGYAVETAGSHDISLFSPTGIHIELHYQLIEERVMPDAENILRNVWADSHVRDGFGCQYEMSDAMFYFYHLAHMAKHFQIGGCGIRTFADLWILDNLGGADFEGRDELMKKSGLERFAAAARRLSAVWFGGADDDSLSCQMQDYILSGGVYGSNENRIAVQQQKKGGALKYALSKIFLQYDSLKFHYPILQKYRFLTPVMEVRRWGKLIFCGHARRSLKELNYNKNITSEQADETRLFLQKLGLD